MYLVSDGPRSTSTFYQHQVHTGATSAFWIDAKLWCNCHHDTESLMTCVSVSICMRCNKCGSPLWHVGVSPSVCIHTNVCVCVCVCVCDACSCLRMSVLHRQDARAIREWGVGVEGGSGTGRGWTARHNVDCKTETPRLRYVDGIVYELHATCIWMECKMWKRSIIWTERLRRR